MTLNERVAQELVEWKQKSCRNKTCNLLKETGTLDTDIRRQIIIGGYLQDLFPQVLQFEPQETESENQVEFAPFICFLTLLADDRVYVEQLTEEVDKAFHGDNETEALRAQLHIAGDTHGEVAPSASV